MVDAPAAERIQTFEVCGRTLTQSAERDVLGEPLSEAYLSVAEPPIDHKYALTIYSGRGEVSNSNTFVSLDADTIDTLKTSLPDSSSVYVHGCILSFMENDSYATGFNGETPLNFDAYPDEEHENRGVRITFGQPDETSGEYILTPSQTKSFIELLDAVDICQRHDDRYFETIDNARTVLSDGSIERRKTLADLFG
jgi:hypothetical protein